MASPLIQLPHSLKPHSLYYFPKLPLSSPFSSLTPQAYNLADKTPLRDPPSLLSSSGSDELVKCEKTPGKNGARNQRNGGFEGVRKMGNSRVSSKKPTNEGSSNFMGVFKGKLDMCSKVGDVMGAISLYDSALENGVKLQQYHYNVLLYLCSSAAIGVIHPAKSGSGSGSGSVSGSGSGSDGSSINSDDSIDVDDDRSTSIRVSDEVREYARKRGFEIYERMCLENVPMSEAALTSVARMAMSMGNGDMAFEIVRQMKDLGLTLRLRSYAPALYAFCGSGNIEKAFEVERHMMESGIALEEPELEALLRASLDARKGDKVYYLLHKLRSNVRQVSLATAELIEAWFMSATAARVGRRKWDWEKVKEAMESGGGGWHGLGWLGKGKWEVVRTRVDDDGICMGCGERLVSIDLDPVETENFARSVESIASKREKSSFEKFQRWLDYYGPFEAVVDAANVGLFSQRKFSLIKVNAVVNAIRQKLPSKKWPLIIVHNRRLLMRKPGQALNEKLIEKWRNADAIYATPTGSNDDWYWLYAAIKCKCLIVTNDEMRDHVFQILENDFFPKWKEKHQVHFNFRDGGFEFHMPPPCSIVIQETEKGHWHIPLSEENYSTNGRTWLCVTRASSPKKMQDSSICQKEAHSDAQASSAQIQQSQVSNIRQKEKIGRSFPRHLRTIISDIEAAEKTSGCVIDFQI